MQESRPALVETATSGVTFHFHKAPTITQPPNIWTFQEYL